MDRPNPILFHPIGYIHTPYQERYSAPRQPGLLRDSEVSIRQTRSTIVLNEGENFEQALEDLEGFEKIWLIYVFNRNEYWKPKVYPPRGERRKRGLFATRSPHRPNPIGLSLVDLINIDGRNVTVGNVDLLDGTPILDIKPYIPM